ncbi:MAG: GTPase ObgE [Bacilli bacterium]
MFIDDVLIKVEAGNGGNGCTAFRREKFVPMGGPFGGNGGRGSNIVFKVDEGLHTLLDLRYQKIIRGDKGENGKGKNQNGHAASDIFVKVPQGTVVTDTDTGLILADLKEKDDEAVIAIGGRGGRGNTAFRTQSNPAPDFSENGEPGEVKFLHVELKLIADVGLVGLPSVGKSTILASVSKSKPKIAAYHFTTLTPSLGVVRAKDGRSFVMADLPGLIEGASHGEGLGDKFLRHIERTKVIAHVIDMGAFEGRDPFADYELINNELALFSQKLMKKPQIVIANKMDLPDAEANLKKFKEKTDVKVYEISAMNQEGMDEVLLALADLLDTQESEPLYEEDAFESHVLYTFKKEEPYTITRDDDGCWVIHGDEVEKLFRMTKFSSQEGILRFAKRLRKMGIDDKLEKLGAKEGDRVRIFNFEFVFDN